MRWPEGMLRCLTWPWGSEDHPGTQGAPQHPGRGGQRQRPQWTRPRGLMRGGKAGGWCRERDKEEKRQERRDRKGKVKEDERRGNKRGVKAKRGKSK